MASYHFHSSHIQRSKGQNAVAHAAYISASKLVYRTIDQESGEEISITYDFTKKQGVAYSKIFLPAGFEDAVWLQDRECLWNVAEAREKSTKSRTGAQIEFSLPKEVSKEQNIRLVEEYVQKNIVSRGIVCDVNIHYDNPDNPHVHIQYLTRRLERLANNEVVLAKTKDRGLESTKFLYFIREECAKEINKVYEEAGLPFRVSAKSFKELGIDQEPTRHKGPAHHMKATELEAKNKEIIAENAKRIYENPEIVFGRISYTKPVFSKEDIAIALSDALIMHLVSKSSDIAQEQESIRAFGKGLVQEQDNKQDISEGSREDNSSKNNSIENVSKSITNNPEIANNSVARAANHEVANNKATNNKTASNKADSRADHSAIEHLNKEYGEEFLRLYNQLLVSDKIELMDQKDLLGRTLYSLKSRVNLERRYVSTIEELNARVEHKLNILDSVIGERNSFKEQLGDLVNIVGANLQNKFNDKIGDSIGLKLDVFDSKTQGFSQKFSREFSQEFSTEQIKAILSVCNGSDISVLEGNPGAGKTFVMREIVRQYKQAGFRVVGTGPSSVSAKVLSRNAGIKADNTSLLRKKIEESRGASFKIDLSSKYYEEEEYLKSIGCDAVFSSRTEGVLDGKTQEILDSKSVLIVDEASMIELANMDYLANEVLRAKAKLVLVGDNNQFTAVGMTGAFNKARKIAGGVKLTEVRRQERLEYRQATEAMGRFAMHEAIEIYRKLGVFNIKDNEEEAKSSLVTSFAKEYTEQMMSLKRDDLIAMRSIAIGAYTNEKVAEFNTRVREELKHSGALKGAEVQISSGGRMLPLMKGDQIVFEENSLRYGISNGEVGTILSVKPSVLSVKSSATSSVKPSVKSLGGNVNSKDEVESNSKGESDGDGIVKILVYKSDGSKDIVNIDTAADAANNRRRIKLNHGYALTGYKLQGETVERMHVYFDRSIGYEAFLVLMSRHREVVRLHASAKELEDIVYQRVDRDVEKVRSQFRINSYETRKERCINSSGEEYIVKAKEAIPNWLIGLTLAVSRRANNSLAIDYKSDGRLDGNQLIIKEYLEARARVFECHGKLREWKSDIESPGSITRLQHNIGLAAKAFNVSLELNSKDLKIDPYGMIFASNKDVNNENANNKDTSNKDINVQNIFKEAAKDQEVNDQAKNQDKNQDNYDAARSLMVKLSFSDLSSEQRNSIIYSCLPAVSWEGLHQCYSALQLAKAAMKDQALLICSSYHVSNNDSGNDTGNNATASMGERIVQLNLNYETIQKHAGIGAYKYYLKDISTHSSLNSCSSYISLIKLARDVISNDGHEVSALTNNQLMSLVNKYLAGIDNYNLDNKELLELKRCELFESQRGLSNLKQEEQAKENFINILLPHYLGRIYEQQGEVVIKKWEAVKRANSDIDMKELIEFVQSNPSMLGKLAGIGLGTILGVSSSRRKSIEQASKLCVQLVKYEEHMARLKEIEHNALIKEQEQKIVMLQEELDVLAGLKASKAEEKLLSSLKTMQAGSGLNIDSFKSLIKSDEVQDLLCEYYNSQNEKYVRINEPDRTVLEQEDIESVTTNSHTNSNTNILASSREDKDCRRGNRSRRDRNSEKEPVLRFDKVQEALSSSDIERIFKDYAASIRGGVGSIKRSGSEISMGSLSMNLSKGTWIRHSSGKGGNIFGFVQEGASVSKRQSLEIVAELAGIRAESNSYDYRTHVANSRANKANRAQGVEQSVEQDKLQMANKWIVAQEKINNADIFDANKHLKGMMCHNTLEAVYAYKDAEDKLLGYVVRFISKEDGKKQTLPVTYCHNAAKEEYSWRLKGFSDKDDKPIFGIEKAICSSKPILIVEGEKAAITAAKILPDYAVISWMGGSNAADKVNWGQLKWRDVIIWPDNDQPGFKAAEVIKAKLNKANDHIGFVSVIDPTYLKFNGSVHKDLLPAKWDLADSLPSGMTIENVKEAIENVRAAHLDLNEIQRVIENSNFNVSQELVGRNIWQEVFKGKIVNKERITSITANEQKTINFFSSEESSNYVKYLEATGKGGVAHDYLKYDSPMYQDLLTSLAAHDERLSESIISLSNSSNTDDIETIEHRAQLIDDAQNLYEKKALEYGGIAGTHEVYRDYLELMMKNYGESHGKVTLYSNIVRDISILHSAQLGMNINDLPDSCHKEIAREVYNTISEWSNRYALDNADKNKIANAVYEAHCTVKAWQQKSHEQVITGYKVYSDYQIRLEEKRLADIERETYKRFDSSLERHQLETQHQVIQQDKENAKTVDEMLTAISREHEFFKSLDGNLKYAEQYDSSILSAISNAKTMEQEQLITNMHNMVVYAQKHGILNDQEILNQFNSSDSHNVINILKNLSTTCQEHYMERHNENIKQLLDDEYVMVGSKKYTCPLKYMKHEMQNNIPGFVDEKQIATIFTKVKAEVKELRLERELEHTMTMRL